MKNFKIESVVFCEGIRLEVGGKHILYGVVAPELNISTVPAVVPVAIWMSIAPLNNGDFEGDIMVSDPNGEERHVAHFKGSIVNTSKASLVIPTFPLNVSSAGIYTFKIRFDNDDWQDIGILVMNYVPSS